MRAMNVLKLLLLVGLMTGAGSAFAIEDMTQGRLGPVQAQQHQRQFVDRSAPFALNAVGIPGNIDAPFDHSVIAFQQQPNIALLQRQITVARMHSAGDGWLMALIGTMLVAYQLCRKHRFLRPQPFAV